VEPELLIRKSDLRRVMLDWVTAYRNGECCSSEETDAMPLDDVVDASTAGLWSGLETLLSDIR
jgi:hypothetical protein